MPAPSRALLAGAALLAATVAGNTPLAADEDEACHKRIAVSGFPHRMKSIAELNAMRAWSEQAATLGEAYGMWHNAKGSQLACEKMSKSAYYRCIAAGQPCPPKAADLHNAVR